MIPSSWPKAPGSAGNAGLIELPDGSLVRPDRYDDRYGRGESDPVERPGDSRTETERDRGRLGYSPSLRRLAGVTQVVSPDLSVARRHSRESHTHKVALVSRELAELVVRRARDSSDIASLIYDEGGLDIAACEAAGLAHDLGHAPFGHAGESELHKLLRKDTSDGFEGNPQSFRIVTRLEGRTFKRQSMELTNVTLCGILKYPWLREDGGGKTDGGAEGSREEDSAIADKPSKYGAYIEDRDQFEVVRRRVMGQGYRENRRQSLEASIMDLADDIAYAIHDLEDFCSAGMIDLHDVLASLTDATGAVAGDTGERFQSSGSQDPFTRDTRKLRDRYQGLFDDTEYYLALERVQHMITSIHDRSSDDTIGVVMRDELSNKIGQYFANLEVDRNVPYEDAAYVRLSRSHWHEVQVLKVITRHWLIQSPQMGVIQRAQTRAVRTLVESLIDWLQTPDADSATLPDGLHTALTSAGVDLNSEKLGKLDARHYRAIGDYVGTLSDSEALLRSNWFAGREIPGMTMVTESY